MAMAAHRRRPAGRVGATEPGRDVSASRPTLGQLVLWLTGCAVYFSLVRTFLPHAPEAPARILLLSGLALYTGLCWTGLVIVLRRLAGRAAAAIEPGAWLLFSLGWILTIDLVVEFLPPDFLVRRESLQIGVTGLALALPTLSRRMPGHWKALFALLTLLVAAQLLGLLGALSLEIDLPRERVAQFRVGRAIAGLVMLAAATLIDHRTGHRRDWLHTLGVAATAIWLLLGAIRT
jgi:hypothetical protein